MVGRSLRFSLYLPIAFLQWTLVFVVVWGCDIGVGAGPFFCLPVESVSE